MCSNRIHRIGLALLLALSSACGDDSSGGDGGTPDASTAGICGDGVVNQVTEECDDGAANSDTLPGACRTDCRRAHCGDAVVDPGEECDDGPQSSDLAPDACRTDCRRAHCGDGVLDPGQGEVCDDGNTASGDGCAEDCQSDETCGNGIQDPFEVCDDGNDEAGDGCSADCRSDETCGNGVVDVAAGEECDQGNENGTPGAACLVDCRLTTCGDGHLGGLEECDAGLFAAADCAALGFTGGALACAANCLVDTYGCHTCGDGVCQSERGESFADCPDDCGVVDTAGQSNNCVVLADGQVRCVGSAEFLLFVFWTLGTGSFSPSTVPVSPLGLADVVQIEAGEFLTCARTGAGDVYCWGMDLAGGIGNGPGGGGIIPTRASIDDVVDLGVGGLHACALRSGGAVWCWGSNAQGQVGDGNLGTNAEAPVQVTGLSGVVDVDAANVGSCAVLDTGQVRCWGDTLGDVPIAITGITGAVEVSVGSDHACARRSNGRIACWGRGSAGQLGNGGTADSLTAAVTVTGITTAVALDAGNQHSCVVLSDGTVQCWGRGGEGQLGNGNTTDQTTPVAVHHLSGVTGIAANYRNTCAILDTGGVRCWGGDSDGALGYGFELDTDEPRDMVIPSGDACPALSISCGERVWGTTTGARSVYEEYGCAGSTSLGGPEVYFRFVAPPGAVSVELHALGGDNLDLLILEEGDYGCEPLTGCVAASQGGASEQLSFRPFPGRAYYLAVESQRGSAGPFELRLECGSDLCGNGMVDPGEVCDDGGETPTCNLDCAPAACGDGWRNASAGEQCDDGNTVDGDGCSATCQAEGCGPLESGFAGTNSAAGNMFEVVALRDLTLGGFDLNLSAGGHPLEVYSTSGSYAGNEGAPSAWTLVGSSYTHSEGPGTSTPLPLTLGIVMTAGERRAFYVTSTAGTLRYHNGTQEGALAVANADLELYQGIGIEYPFGNTFSPRVWEGRIYYTCGP